MGGGTGMGNTCKSMANSFQCMTKTFIQIIYTNLYKLFIPKKKRPLQCCKVISLQLIKINEKNKLKKKTSLDDNSVSLSVVSDSMRPYGL